MHPVMAAAPLLAVAAMGMSMSPLSAMLASVPLRLTAGSFPGAPRFGAVGCFPHGPHVRKGSGGAACRSPRDCLTPRVLHPLREGGIVDHDDLQRIAPFILRDHHAVDVRLAALEDHTGATPHSGVARHGVNAGCERGAARGKEEG